MPASILGKALITGASSAIGASYALSLARRGHETILVDRNSNKLSQLAEKLSDVGSRSVETISANLADAEDLRGVETVLRSDPRISMLINSAEIGATAPLLQSQVDDMEAMVRLNVTATMRLSYAAAPHFADRRKGAIINVASVVALAPERMNGVYAATKAFLLAFSQSLHHELAARGVRIQVVLPGAAASDIWDIAGVPIDLLPEHAIRASQEMVDAALTGFELGELITIPSLSDGDEWERLDGMRRALLPKLSSIPPAERYRPQSSMFADDRARRYALGA